MRKIKFRGQKSDAGKQWVYGWLIQDEADGKCYISRYYGVVHEADEVIPETIGQCTGLKDKNDRDIYEGDIIGCLGAGISEVNWSKSDAMFKIKWHDKIYKQVRSQSQFYTEDGEKIFSNHRLVFEIIGNIYENPELLNNSSK
jgi:uncharacterized phage protein (TIGR01671 family)